MMITVPTGKTKAFVASLYYGASFAPINQYEDVMPVILIDGNICGISRGNGSANNFATTSCATIFKAGIHVITLRLLSQTGAYSNSAIDAYGAIITF